MAVPGDWTLFYDWNCDGGYSSATLTFNSDGTFTFSEGGDGLWVRQAHMLMFTFKNIETTYAGKLASQSVTGIMTTFSGFDGCFCMLQEGVLPVASAKRIADKPDAQGK